MHLLLHLQLFQGVRSWDQSSPGEMAANFTSGIRKPLASHPGAADTLMKSYGITDSMTHDDAAHSILEFSTDIGFLEPTLT